MRNKIRREGRRVITTEGGEKYRNKKRMKEGASGENKKGEKMGQNKKRRKEESKKR
jgi:hypothetical protein